MGRCFIILVVIVFPTAGPPAFAQDETVQRQQLSSPDGGNLAGQAAKSSSDLIVATEEYKASLQKLIPFYEASARSAAERVEKRNKLYAEGVVSKQELEDSQRAHIEAQARLDQTRKQILESDNLIAEAKLAEELAKSHPGQLEKYDDTSAVIRHDGSVPWSLSEVAKVESFFAARFGRSLPVSAFGQTALHDRMGFAHHDAIDVAVHPDTPQGQDLMDYLRTAGIPFFAFRSALPGSATGAHIHIGKPSLRTAFSAVPLD